MNIAESIFQHVKTMPTAKAMEVLHFVEFLETKTDFIASHGDDNDMLTFMQNLPVGKRTDSEINLEFQAGRDEWVDV
ncbi:MAG: hypothetical protein ACRERV_01060 [Methylococcales bacterium]